MMKNCGYGVLVDGKPAGMWPVSQSHAMHIADRYKSTLKGEGKVEVVTVYHGDSIAFIPLPKPEAPSPISA